VPFSSCPMTHTLNIDGVLLRYPHGLVETMVCPSVG
jgi:hypothetical protein